MGKYIIRVESMDMDEPMDQQYQDGIECDGFVVMADQGDGCQVAIHNVNIDIISNMIAGSHRVLAAGVLAKAKRDAVELAKREESGEKLKKLLERLR